MSKSLTIRKQRSRSPSWQVIYMDLMTIIMVFFVIIWSLSQAKDEGLSETIGDVTTRLIDLPGDVLFAAGQTQLSQDGKDILDRLFRDSSGSGVLTFEDNGLVKRMIVIHGHTDSDGVKSNNLELGYQRAMAAFLEIEKYTPELKDHVVICTHADNSAEVDVPVFSGSMTAEQRRIINELKSKNRRITIEDRTVNTFKDEL